jgi:hypothetical protein
MKKLSYLILLVLIGNTVSISAQQNTAVNTGNEPPSSSQIMRKGIAENNYLEPLLELKEREAEYLASKRRKNTYLDDMARLSSYVGDYAALYEYEEKFLASIEPTSKLRASNVKELSESPIDAYQLESALKTIARIADSQRVIMINEEHRTPLHRSFTKRLLPILYKKGFRYLALETLSETDTELNSRKYPVQKSGTYSADPVFGDLIRGALKIGFKIVPYDSDPNCQPKPDNPIFCQDERERGQAQNIYDRILKTNSQAKILVHGGRDHIAEIKEDAGFAYMGWHFKNITKIDPFTIDQMHMSERRNPADEEPIYRYTTRKRTLTEPTAFVSTNGKFWRGGAEHDLKIFHPRAKYENNRPTWLKLEGRKKSAVEFKKLNLPVQKQIFTGQNPILVQAFVTGESADAVPVDQFILYPNKEIPVLMLPKGSFRIRATDKFGKVIGEYKVS